MSASELILLVSLIVGLYAAWNIGANDVSNAMGTSVGSKALTIKQAVIIAGIFEFCGAVFFGSHVSETLQKGLINTDIFTNNPYMLVKGMLASLLAAGIWLQLATYFGWPVSTTHAIVGAIVGFGAIVGGVHAVQWASVFSIATSWIVSPIFGGLVAFCLFTFLRNKIFYTINPFQATLRSLPWLVFSSLFVFSQILLSDKIATASFMIKNVIILSLSAVGALLIHLLCKKITLPQGQIKRTDHYDPFLAESLQKAKKHLERAKAISEGTLNFRLNDVVEEVESLKFTVTQKPEGAHINSEFHWVEKIFGFLQIATACLMAFSHGANDVANAIGPLAAIISVVKTGSTSFTAEFPLWILVLGGFGIVLGLATWGWRVIETVGKKITELTPSRGFAAEFATALTVLLATRFGIPISTTHTLVGSVLGVGLAGGIGALNLLVLKDIILAWIITIPAGAFLSIVCYYIIQQLF